MINDFEKNLHLKFPPQSVNHIMEGDKLLEMNIVNPQDRLVVLDAGGGIGQLSSLLAGMGHKVIICDISSVMLEKAKLEFDRVIGHSHHDTTFIQCAAQVL